NDILVVREVQVDKQIPLRLCSAVHIGSCDGKASVPSNSLALICFLGKHTGTSSQLLQCPFPFLSMYMRGVLKCYSFKASVVFLPCCPKEYLVNGSLDRWIFNQNQKLALGWQIRKKIILDIAKGLAYLHGDCHQKIIHFDIKPENILLDENFNAKISDFGLSKLIGKDQSQVLTTMRGTPGYMAPEWLTSTITEKVDVYSFGIVVLEILCGRRNIDRSQQEEDRHLLELFRRKQEEGQLLDLVVAWCLQTEYVKRPSMSTVVKLFEGSADVVSDNLNEDFLNGLILEATETDTSTILPSILSGP
ncbi:hypothetical protein Gotri_003456, partial [Gossypium trilobum]|nr:hypothetical protein [Gossypium trilobum]